MNGEINYKVIKITKRICGKLEEMIDQQDEHIPRMPKIEGKR